MACNDDSLNVAEPVLVGLRYSCQATHAQCKANTQAEGYWYQLHHALLHAVHNIALSPQ
jgi:hypothetical protein